jgi:hypothetical protein
MEKVRRRISYANVTATLALVLAMSGGAVAATGGFSSAGKLQACVNEQGTIKLLKAGQRCKKGQKAVSWNQEGPAGPRGAQGAAGAAGTTGAAGPAGAAGPRGQDAFTHVVIRRAVKAGFVTGDEIVKCNAGEIAIGGGVTSGSTAAKVWATAPLDLGGEEEAPTAWLAGISNPEPLTTRFYAICASS